MGLVGGAGCDVGGPPFAPEPLAPAGAVARAGVGEGGAGGPGGLGGGATADVGGPRRAPGPLEPVGAVADAAVGDGGAGGPEGLVGGAAAFPGAPIFPPVVVLPPFSSILRDAEDLYAYRLVRGAEHLTEEMYLIVREGYNQSCDIPLLSQSFLRDVISPAVSPWLLPLSTFEVPATAGCGPLKIQHILPSTHLRHDVSFSRTYDLFFAAEQRSNSERLLHPELVDCPFFTNRPALIHPGSTEERFNLAGVCISVGDGQDVLSFCSLPLCPFASPSPTRNSADAEREMVGLCDTRRGTQRRIMVQFFLVGRGVSENGGSRMWRWRNTYMSERG